MTLEAKGRIRFNPDVKPGEPEYIIEAKQLGVSEPGSGDIEQMMNELTERVRRAIAEEFCVAPSSVGIIGYSMGITFAVEGPVNRTLEEFSIGVGKQEGDDTKITITADGHPPIETDMKRLEPATKIMEISVATGLSPDQIITAAKRKKGDAE